MDQSKKFLAFSIVFASILISGSLVFLGVKMSSAPTNVLDIPEEKPAQLTGDFSDDDAFLGDKDAPITVVEFSDFQCPYCRNFFNETLPLIKKEYIDTGKVKFVYRDYPLSSHKGAFPAALASECAREQGKDEAFFAMHNKIFEGQNALGQGTVNITDKSLISYAEELDLDMDQFNKCFEEEKYKDEIYKDLADGQEARISGTPGFIINGQVVVGAQPFSTFKEIFENILTNN